jgi:hypothetical protein
LHRTIPYASTPEATTTTMIMTSSNGRVPRQKKRRRSLQLLQATSSLSATVLLLIIRPPAFSRKIAAARPRRITKLQTKSKLLQRSCRGRVLLCRRC